MKLKINNPHHINTKNYRRDGSIVELSYIGFETAINAADKRPYDMYKFLLNSNSNPYDSIKFELHTKINENKRVQLNMWKDGGFTTGAVSVEIVKDRDKLINELIKWAA
jgi:hypothetical protein